MKVKIFLITMGVIILSFSSFPVDGTTPTFSTTDNLNEFGAWQTTRQLTTKGKENITIPISYRHKVVKMFALTCKFTVEIKNESDKKIQLYYLAGNGRTDYYAGKAGAIKEKVKLDPGETTSINYPLPTKNFKPSDDAEECKKCKELEHLFMIGNLEVK
jgi:hypothetical protein